MSWKKKKKKKRKKEEDRGKTDKAHLFLGDLLFFCSFFLLLLERYITLSNVHSTEIQTVGKKHDCNHHAFLPRPVRKTESFRCAIGDTKDNLVTAEWTL